MSHDIILSVFCRTDTTTDSKGFYNSILAFLNDPDEKDDVSELLDWWNWSARCWVSSFSS